MRALAVAVVTVLAGVASAVAATPTFGPARLYDEDVPPVNARLLPANLDGNARADLVVAENGYEAVLQGTAETGFPPPIPNSVSGVYIPPGLSNVEAVAPAVADFTRDGLDDILTFDSTGTNDDILLGPGDGFGLVVGCGCSGLLDMGDLDDASDVLLAARDVDGDGAVDFAITDDTTGRVNVFRGNGAYTVPPDLRSSHPFVGRTYDDIVIAQLDTTTASPEIAALQDNGQVVVFEDTGGNLGFASRTTLTPSTGASTMHRLAAADLTGDGVTDLIASDPAADTITIYPGGVSLGSGAATSVLGDASVLAAGDLNGDGRTELVVGTTTTDVLHVLTGAATGSLTPLTTINAGTATPSAIAVADFDGDARSDVVGAYSSLGLRLALNRSLPVSTVAAPGDFGSQTVGTVGAPRTVTISNTGAAPLRVTSVRSDSDDFIVSGESCVGAAIAAGAACSARVRFAPTAAGARAGTLTIAGNTAAPATVALSGTGAMPASSDSSNAGPPGPRGPRGQSTKPANQPRARCRIRPARIQCVVYNAKTQPWRFNKLRTGRLGHRRIPPGRYRLTVIHADRDGRLTVYRRWVRVR